MTERFAAIDLGSNSFRLEAGHFIGRRFISEKYIKETVRLAGGLTVEGALSKKIQEKALIALYGFSMVIKGMDPDCVKAVGTQALRCATNAANFIGQAEKVLGHRIEIISGQEEGRLVFKGCACTLPPSSETRLVIDIGGASTELVLGRGGNVLRSDSFPLGSVNMSARFFGDGLLSEERFCQAMACARRIFDPEAHRFGRPLWDHAYGSAGTIGAVELLARSENWGSAISEEVLAHALRAFSEAGCVTRLNFRGLKPDRRDIIPGGLAILCALFKSLGLQRLETAAGSLRYGLLFELLENWQSMHKQNV